jgi:hypothetical protein
MNVCDGVLTSVGLDWASAEQAVFTCLGCTTRAKCIVCFYRATHHYLAGNHKQHTRDERMQERADNLEDGVHF